MNLYRVYLFIFHIGIKCSKFTAKFARVYQVRYENFGNSNFRFSQSDCNRPYTWTMKKSDYISANLFPMWLKNVPFGQYPAKIDLLVIKGSVTATLISFRIAKFVPCMREMLMKTDTKIYTFTAYN